MTILHGFTANSDLPAGVSKSVASEDHLTLFRETFNANIAGSELLAFAKAYRALELAGLQHRDGQWIAKESPTVGAVHMDGPLGGNKKKPKSKDDPGTDPADVEEIAGEVGEVPVDSDDDPPFKKLFVPPVEVRAAANRALDSQVYGELTLLLSKEDGLSVEQVKNVFELHKLKPESSSVDTDFLGGTHAAKWAERVLRKYGKDSISSPEAQGVAETTPDSSSSQEQPALRDGADIQKLADGENGSQPLAGEFEISGTVVKVDSEKHLVFGFFSVVTIEGRPVVDVQGDVIRPEDLANAAYSFVLDSRTAGNMHQDGPDGDIKPVGRLVESVFLDNEKTTAMVAALRSQNVNAVIDLNNTVCWWGGFYIEDDSVWDAIKQGRLTSFSIGGTAKRDLLAA